MTFDFTGQTVFVAGGTSGINLGVAQAFARAGARVAVVVRDDGAFGANGDGGGHGLGNMRVRAEALGGSFALTNGDGTTVRAEIPLEA